MERPELPDGFLQHISELLHHGERERFAASLCGPAPVSVRHHPFKSATDQPPPGNQVPWCSLGEYLDQRPSFHKDPLWHAGAYYVQEASSMLLEQVVQHIDLPENAVALDACAAPGGKSTHLLDLLGCASFLVANEVVSKRRAVLQENLLKWGYANYAVTGSDIRRFRGLTAGCFDLVLVDAPCSGEGLFRKDPKAMAAWSPAHSNSCALRQQHILDDLEGLVAPGGYLVYSTCTYSVAENEERLATLIGSANWEHVELPTAHLPGVVRGAGGIGLRCYPHRVKGEGFFIACIRRTGRPAKRPAAAVSGTAKEHQDLLEPWLSIEGMSVIEEGDRIRLLPAAHAGLLGSLRSQLHVEHAGLYAGKLVRGTLLPSHQLSQSLLLRPGLPEIRTDLSGALLYLGKGGLPKSPEMQPGWYLVKYKGVHLGWAKVLEGRINNYYPKSLSIRP